MILYTDCKYLQGVQKKHLDQVLDASELGGRRVLTYL